MTAAPPPMAGSAALAALMPVTPIGVQEDGPGPTRYIFRLETGEQVAPSFAELAQPQALAPLCGGEAWLRRQFPAQLQVVNGDTRRTLPVGFDAVRAARFLCGECIAATIKRHAMPARSFWRRVIARLPREAAPWK